MTEQRLRLLELGYTPIPAQGKVPALKGWPKAEVTREMVAGWEGEFPRATTTAIRCGEVIAVDLDIDDLGLAAEVVAKALTSLGESPIRLSRGSRAALLYRTSDVVVKKITGKFLKEGVEASVEVKGRRCLQNVAGPHSPGHAYSWDRDLPPVGELTEVTQEQLDAFLDGCKEMFEAAGFETAAPQAHEGTVVKDITPDMEWGHHGTTAELREECEHHGLVRVCVAPVRPGAQNPMTGMASAEHGKLKVFDNGTCVMHLEVDTLEEDLAELGAALGGGGGGEFRFRGAAQGSAGDGGSGEGDRATTVGLALPDDNGRLTRPTWRNVLAITAAMGWQPRFNIMTGRGELWRGGERLQAVAMQHLIDECDQVHRIRDRGVVERTVTQITHDVSVGYHPMEDWVQAVAWDGRGRVAAMLDSVVTAEEHWHSIMRTWMLQVVQGVCGWRKPKPIELVPILLGGQGIGKTTWIRGLLPQPWVCTGAHLEFGMAKRGVSLGDAAVKALAQPITELGEIETTYQNASIEALKSFLSDPVDSDRRPFQKDPVDRPRVTSFIGTANQRGVLHDGSGSRRFAPFWVTRIHRLGWGEKDLQQLWAEVYAGWKAGEQWWLTDEQEAARTAVEGHYTDTPIHLDELRDKLSEKASALPVEEWGFAGLWELFENLEMDGKNPKVSGSTTEWLNRHWHVRSEIVRGVEWKAKRCWLLPIKGLTHPLATVSNPEKWAQLAERLRRIL